MLKHSPYQSASYRKAAHAAAMNRIRAEEKRTPERIEEDLSSARRRVEELERELEDAKRTGEEPEEKESVEARLSPRRIYARQNASKRGAHGR
ncbi:hypothetical protein [Halomonas sp. E14]|uniref:hypothetical protein n=1 Tax=Halomonas sp. E14 TaxID=3397245 RepID=UPI00403E8374